MASGTVISAPLSFTEGSPATMKNLAGLFGGALVAPVIALSQGCASNSAAPVGAQTGGAFGAGGGAPAGGSGAGGSGGAAGAEAGAGSGGSPDSSGACMVASLLSSLGRSGLLVGASMDDAVATQAPFELRYLYLSGGLFDGTAPCTSCQTGCTSRGTACANTAGCGWWGCWQYDQDPPGAYVRAFVQKAAGNKQIPMFTYYQILQSSGVAEGQQEVTIAARDQALMTRYFADYRFVLQQIGQSTAFLHIEPDFWGYAEQQNNDPHALAAAVASANATDCAGQENTIAGLGRCLIAMVRKYAPNAKVGLHASGWGTNFDVLNNTNASLDVVGQANKLGAFIAECGASQGDFVVVETSDRDAGYYSSIGQNRWWNDTNTALPNFRQAFAWAKALAEKVGRPLVWWQMPLGNMSLANATDKWRDNRLDYFFAHMNEVAMAHGFAVAYGAGAGGQTTPTTDGGNLIAKTKAYAAAGGQTACP
jgi:hypothetical protein